MGIPRQDFRSVVVLGLVLGSAAAAGAVDFAHEIAPILKQHCGECHMGDKKQGGLSLNTRESVLAGSENGEVVESTRAAESYLIELISTDDDEIRMPPKGERVSAAEIALLRKWIDAGLPWEAGFSFGSDTYEPPLKHRAVVIPQVDAELSSDIDRLVFGYFQENGIKPPASVGDSVFLRRASLDLIGILPSREATEAFLADTDPDKRAKLIDTLLSRDADYAAHWLTFWNDLLRNAYQGTGFIDGGRRWITDWLIPALAANVPYDQMIRELVNPEPISEGFISGIRWRGDVTASQGREVQFSQNIGQVFLGINMKCASCHDSFVDHWKLDEAYGLAAIIADRPIEIHRCDKATGKFAKAGWVFPELGQIDPEAPRNERLQQLAELLVHPDNGRTTRTMANRIWHRLMGRGIVHPVDAMDTRPWSEPLLDHLANELVAAGYDLKALMAKIAKSRVYQLASVAVADDADLISEYYRFAGPIARLMTAEQFIDNVEQLGGIQRTDDPSSRGRSHAAPGRPRSFLTSSEARKLSQAFKVYAPSAQVAADNVLEMRSQFSAAGDVDAVIHLGHWQGGTVQLNGEEIGKTGDVLRHPVRAGVNRLLLTLPPDPRRVQEISGYVLAGQDLLLDGSTAWESRTGNGLWTAMVQYHRGFPHYEPFRRDAEARRFATVSSLLQIRFPELTAARASLRENNLLMRSLGRPNREQVVSMRQERLTMLQAMGLSNGADFTQLISEVAASYREPTDLVRDVYLRTLCRGPSEQELQIAAEILATQMPESKEDFFWSVLLLPEFQIIR